jgi:hypothetical protein
MDVKTFSAFFSELGKLAEFPWHRPIEAKATRQFFKLLRGVPFKVGDPRKGEVGDLVNRAGTLLSSPRFRDQTSRAASDVLGGYNPNQLVFGSRARIQEKAEKALPLLEKGPTPLVSVQQQAFNLPMGRLIKDNEGVSPTLGDVTVKTLEALKKSRIAKAYEKGSRGKLRFTRGSGAGSRVLPYEVDGSGWSFLYRKEPGTRKNVVDEARAAVAKFRANEAARAGGPPPAPASGGGSAAPAVLGAAGAGLLGYGAYRHLRKKNAQE